MKTTKVKTNKPAAKLRKGFACISAERQREIARMGGLAVASKGRKYMATIGTRGGLVTLARKRALG